VQQAAVPLRLDEARPPADLQRLPFRFSIAMAVRPGDETLLR
jgi:hypothetical protein